MIPLESVQCWIYYNILVLTVLFIATKRSWLSTTSGRCLSIFLFVLMMYAAVIFNSIMILERIGFENMKVNQIDNTREDVIKKIASMEHNEYCFVSHTDQCGWYYEKSYPGDLWSHHAHEEQLRSTRNRYKNLTTPELQHVLDLMDRRDIIYYKLNEMRKKCKEGA